ncbi:DEAD/DEAH box helicase family protein [Colwellia sp. Bg11-12]|uniref:DEAD/DEAH box helicase family protein n=1 Tax=Colwellia sp. Bg11-12 TaxID=2759817 RepID=UPI0015F5435E|nr:DEAD/DEAH box helicase family protein [Colwellia sp. Bg11-12]MBA6264281.1 DEAD/DEAH box helicase family protein [Colwellia sp. Bg11-12]
MNLRFKGLFLSDVSTWKELEKKIELLSSTKDKGDAFEEFVYLFLLLKKNYYQIKEVYMHPIPIRIKDKLGIVKYDAGIDGVIEFIDGRLAAYQVKFRTDRAKPKYEEWAKLWAEAKKADATYCIANCDSITVLAEQQDENYKILVDTFDGLPASFFDEVRSLILVSKKKHLFFDPEPHQKKIITDVIHGFSENDRGKVIAACGTGKTLTSLWISEALNSKTILFVAPSLSLIKQTLMEWSDQIKQPFRYVCICSDRTVASEYEDRFNDEIGDLEIQDVDFSVTTNSNDLNKFLSKHDDIGITSIVFSTYQSLSSVGEATRDLSDFSFDLSIFDEAHRTAGIKASGMFSYGLSDDNIKITKRLFMTATEKLIKPRVLERAQENIEEVELFSMNDEDKYGKVFSKLNFGQAIQQEIISDYEIVIATVKSSEIFDQVKNNPKFIAKEFSSNNVFTHAQSIFKQLLIAKCFDELNIKKAISFHSSINQAKAFVTGSGVGDYELKSFVEMEVGNENSNEFFFGHVNGGMSAGQRKQILDEFENASLSLVSNSQCLTEGVNLPQVDCVYFVDSKHSMIDIIQACGRALRKSRNGENKDKAYFVIPILIDDSVSEEEFINSQDFTTIHNIIQALRDEDSRLADWVEEINLNHVAGRTVSCPQFTGKNTQSNNKVKILGYSLNLEAFSSQIALRIATINAKSHSSQYEQLKVYGKNDRKASVKRIFKSIADYGTEAFKNNLITPTLDRLIDLSAKVGDEVTTKQMNVHRNALSHCTKIGMFKENGRGKYLVTQITKDLIDKKITFEGLYQRQLVLYHIVGKEGVLFPYAVCLYVLYERERLTFLEFVYALYSSQGSSRTELLNSIKIIDYIRDNYPMIESLSQSNKKTVIDDLNSKFGLSYKVTDIWDKKQTSINNQFIYFKNNLSIFPNLINLESMRISLKRSDRKKVSELLSKNIHFNKDTVDIDTLKEDYLIF